VTRQLSPRFVEAVRCAIDAHGEQARKGTKITYVSHLLAVSALVLEHGGDEELAIAGLLHDAVEDANDGDGTAMAARIRHAFGERVADVVLGCSDTEEQPKPPWRQRKERYVAHLAEAPDDVVLVSACDKLHNARCTVADLREFGPDFWLGSSGVTFNAGPDEQRWYYEALLAVFRDRFREDSSRRRLLADLDCTIGELSALAV
jgi:(p)ppGpp synthase/HD superfamily hydrolase